MARDDRYSFSYAVNLMRASLFGNFGVVCCFGLILWHRNYLLQLKLYSLLYGYGYCDFEFGTYGLHVYRFSQTKIDEVRIVNLDFEMKVRLSCSFKFIKRF